MKKKVEKRGNEAIGTSTGIIAGAAAGAKIGAGLGIVGGPAIAMAGTVPGAISGISFFIIKTSWVFFVQPIFSAAL